MPVGVQGPESLCATQVFEGEVPQASQYSSGPHCRSEAQASPAALVGEHSEFEVQYKASFDQQMVSPGCADLAEPQDVSVEFFLHEPKQGSPAVPRGCPANGSVLTLTSLQTEGVTVASQILPPRGVHSTLLLQVSPGASVGRKSWLQSSIVLGPPKLHELAAVAVCIKQRSAASASNVTARPWYDRYVA